MEYKDTLNLPRTDFPMKADLPNREPKIITHWSDTGLYAKLRDMRARAKKFILHDGPPYANGNIHMGHALNKILKDIVVRFATMRGYDSLYVPGWDCHGLPVEHQLFKELKLTKHGVDQLKFRKQAHDYAMKYVAVQRDEFRRLGIMGEWDDPYLTLSKDYEAAIARSFGRLVEKGYIYKDLKPVNWCATCETALAEAEVEYEDKASPSIYVKFQLLHDERRTTNGSTTYFVIWTTTPWTLLANVAIAVHPEAEYVYVKARDNETYIMAGVLVPAVMQKIGVKDYSITKKLKGSKLDGLAARHPFIDRDSKIVLADYVSMEDGTGCVHTAPGHGQSDYVTGRRCKLPVIMPVDHKGRFDDTCGEFSRLDVIKANGPILERLASAGHLLHKEEVTHSYPHCWRCKKPIIFRATEQYFLSIDRGGLRQAMLKTIANDVKWVPASGEARISAMVANRPDWCLSRQRLWGAPIIAFYCKSCNELVLDGAVIEHVARIFEKEGADAWFSKAENDLVPRGTKCAKCGRTEFRKEADIIDVWFDSGVSHQAVLKKRKDLDYPCELYLEGSDQHRGWFQSALITAMGIDGKAPYRTVLTHGFVVDGEGKKMSKSLGNVITPAQVMKKYGADILRLWAASSDYSEDVRMSDEILERLADAYRKIRNTFKYLLSNLYDFEPSTDSVAYDRMLEIDKWILSCVASLIKDAQSYYESYAFHKVYRAVYDFCVNEVSSVYLDVLKDRMYTFAKDSAERRSGQTAMYEILTALLKVTAPLLVFTSDEAWGYLACKHKKASVHLEYWPDASACSKWTDKGLEDEWAVLSRVREDVLKKIEQMRSAGIIGASLEASVTVVTDDAAALKVLAKHRDFLRYLFIVSGADVIEGSPDIIVKKAAGAKCARCWNYSEAVGKDERHPALCERCVSHLVGGMLGRY